MENTWGLILSLSLAISAFKSLATTWNKEIFGNIFVRKKKLLARKDGLQKALATRPSAFLISLEQELSLEYASILNQEEEFWALKSWVDWQIFGDRNIAFFHMKTIMKTKQNKIRKIMNHTREWVNDEDQVMDIILNGFKELYQTQHLASVSTEDIDINWAAALFEEESCKLSAMPSALEIHKALSSLKPYKSPGMDGLHAGFF